MLVGIISPYPRRIFFSQKNLQQKIRYPIHLIQVSSRWSFFFSLAWIILFKEKTTTFFYYFKCVAQNVTSGSSITKYTTILETESNSDKDLSVTSVPQRCRPWSLVDQQKRIFFCNFRGITQLKAITLNCWGHRIVPQSIIFRQSCAVLFHKN